MARKRRKTKPINWCRRICLLICLFLLWITGLGLAYIYKEPIIIILNKMESKVKQAILKTNQFILDEEALSAQSPIATSAPTLMPSDLPTGKPSSYLSTIVRYEGNTLSSADRAYKFMSNQSDMLSLTKSGRKNVESGTSMTVNDKLYQRFTMLTMWYSLSDNFDEPPLEDECEWEEVVCHDSKVTEIHMARKGWNGMIPTTIGLLKGLEFVDLAENKLRGTIPEQLFECNDLKFLYLHDNQLIGTLSDLVGDLYYLERIFLSRNKLTGTLPRTLRSQGNLNKLKYLILNHNKLSGTIPSDLNLASLYILDLSFNYFVGTIGSDSFGNSNQLRLIYLNNNKLSGTIPVELVTAGKEKINSIDLSDNRFTGHFPFTNSWVENNSRLQTLLVQKNNFNSDISQEICNMSVYEYGDMVQMDADCDLCYCEVLCDHCGNSYDDDLDNDFDDGYDNFDDDNGHDDFDDYSDNGYDDFDDNNLYYI